MHDAQIACCAVSNKVLYWEAWVAQWVTRLTLAQVMILWLMSLSPASGCVLTAQGLEPALDSLSAPPLFVLCLSLSLNNK